MIRLLLLTRKTTNTTSITALTDPITAPAIVPELGLLSGVLRGSDVVVPVVPVVPVVVLVVVVGVVSVEGR